MSKRKIRVLVVDDSFFTIKFLSEAIASDVGLEVVGTAADAYEARDKIIELNPDVMTLDVDMPRMNGLDFLKQLMPQYPMPVLVVSAASNLVFDALQAGAVDFLSKTNMMDENRRDAFISELIVKIKIASIAKVGKHKPPYANTPVHTPLEEQSKIIAMGASTGGTEATNTILKDCGGDLPGIVMVQHMPPVFTRLYAERLNNTCPLAVREARDGDDVLPGLALLAPGDYQMEVVRRGNGYRVKVYQGEKVSGHCPSVDVLFSSVAKAAGGAALGILLTGMGADGARGMLMMKEAGATNIGQNKESCIVYGMPMVAKNLGAITYELPLDQIAKKIYAWSQPRK
ncbi:MAG: chemotaxis response regulator protein-glutamate methylesterase [Clostridiales bacterium]|jgi:two-component system chemotaxis response regulator CheB|nr:chemotaxis response regulator protein-glutamate methylesterase [Clostridiales bacterium]